MGEERAWKLFALVPVMFLHRSHNTGSVGRSQLAQRVEDFTGRWSELLSEVRREVVRSGEPQCNGDEKARRGAAAQRRVEREHISRARQELTGASLAPKSDDVDRVAKQAATRGAEPHPTARSRLRTGVRVEVRPVGFRHLTPNRAMWFVSRSRRMHVRDAESVFE